MVKNLKPDLALLDLGLPAGNGLSLLRELRTTGEPTEVIVVSGYAGRDVVRAAVQLGVVDYLVKPFWPARLTEALHSFSARTDALARTRLNQKEVDRVRLGSEKPQPQIPTDGPLEKVRQVLVSSGLAMTAAEIADQAGMARVTARRYLERLVEADQCRVDQLADGPGRPRKLYRLRVERPVGGESPPRASQKRAGPSA